MTKYEREKAKLIAQGFEVDAYEGIDRETREEHLVLSYWDSHTLIEMIFDLDGYYLYNHEVNDWDFV